MQQFLITLGIIVAAALVYWPILKKARVTIAERSAAGLGNGIVYAILLLPLVGPFVYLAFHRQLQVNK